MSAKIPQQKTKEFKLQKHASVGAADAIEDKRFLAHCFIDNGELGILRDTTKPECVVMGRTGSGKTALLEQLIEEEDIVIKVSPESLSLSYISNSNILRFLAELGVKLDIFYRLLWRHIFAVEIIKKHFHITNEQSRDTFLAKIKELFVRDKGKQLAIDYLTQWGESFWKETDYRVKEITTKLEQDITKSVSGVLGSTGTVNASFQIGKQSNKGLTEEQKSEVFERSQQVINQIQINKLSEVINFLDTDILDDRQKKYFITIDRLDEDWIADDLRYRLIRALLEAVRDFNDRITNVKIVVALREDLIDRVFRETRDAGYQEEKYKSMYLILRWTKVELTDLLNCRVNQLVREQYTTTPGNLKDILPNTVNKEDVMKFLLERTMLRPRDAIMFLNECIKAAEGIMPLTQTNILAAEAIYSENRLRALQDEWFSDYPNLIDMCFFLKKYPASFKLKDIDRNNLQNFMTDFIINHASKPDVIYHMIEDKYSFERIDELLQELLRILYRVGFIGIKPESYTSPYWSFHRQKIEISQINNDAIFFIHPAFWRVLGIKPQ